MLSLWDLVCRWHPQILFTDAFSHPHILGSRGTSRRRKKPESKAVSQLTEAAWRLRSHYAMVFSERIRRQLREATSSSTFPMRSWLAAGACLVGLGLLEVFVTSPIRKQQEAEGKAPSVSIFGDGGTQGNLSGNRKSAG